MNDPGDGVVPPARTLVAVGAMAPVTAVRRTAARRYWAARGKRSAAAGAPPIIRSATIAESKDSTPARKAITKADGKQVADPLHADMGQGGQGQAAR